MNIKNERRLGLTIAFTGLAAFILAALAGRLGGGSSEPPVIGDKTLESREGLPQARSATEDDLTRHESPTNHQGAEPGRSMHGASDAYEAWLWDNGASGLDDASAQFYWENELRQEMSGASTEQARAQATVHLIGLLNHVGRYLDSADVCDLAIPATDDVHTRRMFTAERGETAVLEALRSPSPNSYRWASSFADIAVRDLRDFLLAADQPERYAEDGLRLLRTLGLKAQLARRESDWSNAETATLAGLEAIVHPRLDALWVSITTSYDASFFVNEACSLLQVTPSAQAFLPRVAALASGERLTEPSLNLLATATLKQILAGRVTRHDTATADLLARTPPATLLPQLRMVDLSNLDAASLSFDAALSVLERGLTSTDGTISTAEICQMLESLATAPNAEKAGARQYIADLTTAHCRSK